MTVYSRISAMAAGLAAISMAAAPATAAELPVPAAAGASHAEAGWHEAGDTYDAHRRYRYRRHRGIDAGDVIAGALIIGGIAAIASAADRSERDRDYRYRDYRYRDYRYRDYRDRDWRDDSYDYRRRGSSRYADPRGIDRAVDMCLREIERDVRVETVDSVDRTAEGWRVTGSLYNGEGFTCSIGRDGRIEDVDYGARLSAEDRQWDADRYAQARSEADTDGNRAYTANADEDADDGRYGAGSTGDFGA